MTKNPEYIPVERVQLGVRMEKKMVQVLKGIAEFKNESLCQLLEEIVLHTFEPLKGQEGQYCASPFGKKTLEAIEGLKRVFGMDYDSHSSYRFRDKTSKAE